MRSLSIFHDSMFYCLYESLYPAFLLDVLLAGDISLRSVTLFHVYTFITVFRFPPLFPRRPLLPAV